ncbi:hypothetical protein BDQ12DRAFT_671019 [Crucibulum laeve]|uniref:Uncharacterized protein n=1 Tax=Crucibulum laeve TaxID=68775 RepID=A0A5C3LIS2_9AGAR|nr:hypothetical protein BDQ12DRAFT_671019 [Crucibulum laeve]
MSHISQNNSTKRSNPNRHHAPRVTYPQPQQQAASGNEAHMFHGATNITLRNVNATNVGGDKRVFKNMSLEQARALSNSAQPSSSSTTGPQHFATMFHGASGNISGGSAQNIAGNHEEFDGCFQGGPAPNSQSNYGGSNTNWYRTLLFLVENYFEDDYNSEIFMLADRDNSLADDVVPMSNFMLLALAEFRMPSVSDQEDYSHKIRDEKQRLIKVVTNATMEVTSLVTFKGIDLGYRTLMLKSGELETYTYSELSYYSASHCLERRAFNLER